eukprot:TRINITY_DN39091_c0_g1_i1.p1 TRINITY_DN39091_c0_g1~~TRINITY_DN39091_c0_g1_i1.p1  ORF type:complete len:239 (+),score=24.84 TRINITY_DN39091_c0_g1_i1:168-884(+)
MRETPRGLKYCTDFVTPEEESELVNIIDAGGGEHWIRFIRRAQQFFGIKYYQTSHKCPDLQPTGASSMDDQFGRPLTELPHWLLPRVLQTGAFDGTTGINQVAANDYRERAGIGVHVEDPAAGGTICALSLLSPVEFTLSRAPDGKPVPKERREREDCVKVLLEPRSLLVLQGDSRYMWAHCIRASRLVHLRDGSTLKRAEDFRRVSLTFREILKDERTAQRQDFPDGYVAFQPPPRA